MSKPQGFKNPRNRLEPCRRYPRKGVCLRALPREIGIEPIRRTLETELLETFTRAHESRGIVAEFHLLDYRGIAEDIGYGALTVEYCGMNR